MACKAEDGEEHNAAVAELSQEAEKLGHGHV